jgi:hypothetical protein
MRLLTAHKILISSAIPMFLIYGIVELRHYWNGDSSALLRVGFAAASTVGLAFYLRWVWTQRPSGD